MAAISFQCDSCKQPLKVSEERAGRRVKCSKCGAAVTVPNGKAEEKPPAPPPPPPPAAGDDDDGPATYGVQEMVPNPTLDDDKPKEKKKEGPKTKRKLKLKTVQYPELWEKVRVGLVILIVAVCIWGAAFVIQSSIMLLGAFSGQQYATLLGKLLENAKDVPIGQEPPVPRFDLAVGLVAGSENLSLARTLLIVVQVLSLFQTGVALLGYFFCMMVPNRYGTKGLAMSLAVLAALNATLVVLFKLLPMTGLSNFVLWYFMIPEVSLMTPNLERSIPLVMFWAHTPFWEIILGLFFTLCLYAEPIIFCLFLRACALSLRDPILEPKSMVLVQLAFGQAFIMVCYQMLSLTGTSDVVIVYTLKAVFLLWMGFFGWLLIWYGMMLWNTRKVILKYIVATEEQEAAEGARTKDKRVPAYLRGDDDDDEDEDDEDEEEDDEEEDEEEEEEPPKKRKKR